VEHENYQESRLAMYIDRYLRHFLLTSGEDPYNNVDKTEVVKEKKETEHNNRVGVVLTEEKMIGKSSISSVKSATLNNWYSESKALACMLETDCFAYVEGKLCIYDSKYIQRDENGRIFLTNYAKEHEEECFLQFIVDDETGELHYITLPATMASKSFNYYDEINEDLLTQYGLVNEISNEMLIAISGLDFGKALTKLMSKNICNYSVRLLKSTTGLDNNTISNLRKVNVISACLGVHIPFRVSNKMLQLAELSLNSELPGKKGQENSIYDTLLHLKWATDYDDVYDELKEQSYDYLIHQPPVKK
jgi:type I restriction enzyme R subunit